MELGKRSMNQLICFFIVQLEGYCKCSNNFNTGAIGISPVVKIGNNSTDGSLGYMAFLGEVGIIPSEPIQVIAYQFTKCFVLRSLLWLFLRQSNTPGFLNHFLVLSLRPEVVCMVYVQIAW